MADTTKPNDLNNLPFQSRDNPVSFEITPKPSYPSMELDTTPVSILPKNKPYKAKRISSDKQLPSSYLNTHSFRTRERKSEFDQQMELKFKEIKRHYKFYKISLSSLRQRIESQKHSLEVWEHLTSEYDKMYRKYDGLANLMIKKLTINASQMKMGEEKYRMIDEQLKKQTNEYIDGQDRLASFQDEFLEMYEVFRIYMFSKQRVDIGNDLCNLHNQIAALKDYFLIKMDKYTLGDTQTNTLVVPVPTPAQENWNSGKVSRHSLNSLKKKSQIIGANKEEISYNLSMTMNSQGPNANHLGVKQNVKDQTMSRLSNLMSNYKIIKNGMSHNRQQDSHNMSFFDKIMNNNLLHDTPDSTAKQVDWNQDASYQNEFDVMNSMNLGLDDTRGQIGGLSRINSGESHQFKNILSMNFAGNSGGGGMNPDGMPGLGLSGIKSVNENFAPEAHDSAIKSVREQIEEMTTNKKESKITLNGKESALNESIVETKRISNLQELSDLHKRKSARVIRKVQNDNLKYRSKSQFGRKKKTLPGESSTFNVNISKGSFHFDFEPKMDKIQKNGGKEDKTDQEEEEPDSKLDSNIHNVYNNQLNSINNSFDPLTFQSKKFEDKGLAGNPMNDMSQMMQDLIRRTTHDKDKENEDTNPMNITKGIDDILGNGLGALKSGPMDSGVNMADQSYNVLIGIEGHDFDYPEDEEIKQNQSENSFDMPVNSLSDDKSLEEVEKKPEEALGEKSDQERLDALYQDMSPVNNINLPPVDVNISMDFEDAKPNIETPSEVDTVGEGEDFGYSKKSISHPVDLGTESEEITTIVDTTMVGKSSLEETPRPSDIHKRSNLGPEPEPEPEPVHISIKNQDEDEISLSKTDKSSPKQPTGSSIENLNQTKSNDKSDKIQSLSSIKSIDLDRESQRVIMSSIMEYVTNGKEVRESGEHFGIPKDLVLDNMKMEDPGTTDQIDEIDETNASFESDDQENTDFSGKQDSDFRTPTRKNPRPKSESIQILQNSSNNDIIFQRNKKSGETLTSGDLYDDYSTVAGTTVTESVNQNQPVQKMNELRNKFKKKSNMEKNLKRDKEKLEELSRNRNRTRKGANEEPKRKKSTNDLKAIKVRQSLYHNSKKGDAPKKPSKSSSRNNLVPSPKRSNRTNKSKNKKDKSQNKSKSRRTIANKGKASKTPNRNKSYKKKKLDTTPSKKNVLKMNKNPKLKKKASKIMTPKDIQTGEEVPIITMSALRNTGEIAGMYEIKIDQKDFKKTRAVKERRKQTSFNHLERNRGRKEKKILDNKSFASNYKSPIKINENNKTFNGPFYNPKNVETGGKLNRDQFTKNLDPSLMAEIEESFHQEDSRRVKMGKIVDKFLLEEKTPTKSRKSRKNILLDVKTPTKSRRSRKNKKTLREKDTYRTQMKDEKTKKNKYRSFRLEKPDK